MTQFNLTFGIEEEFKYRDGSCVINNVNKINAFQFFATTNKNLVKFEPNNPIQTIKRETLCGMYVEKYEVVIYVPKKENNFVVAYAEKIMDVIYESEKINHLGLRHILFSPKSSTIVCFGVGIKTYRFSCPSANQRRSFVDFPIKIELRASFCEDYIASSQVQPVIDEDKEHILIATPKELLIYDLDGHKVNNVIPLKSTNWQIFTINPYNNNYLTQDLDQGICYWDYAGRILRHFVFATAQLLAVYFINAEFCFIVDVNLNTFIIDLETQQMFRGIKIEDHSNRFLFIRGERPYFITCGLVTTFYRISTYWRLWNIISTPILKMERCESPTKAARILFKLSDTSFQFLSPRSAQIIGFCQSKNTALPCDFVVDRATEDENAGTEHFSRDLLIVQYEDGSLEFYQTSESPFSSIASLPKLGATSFDFGNIECINENRRVIIIGTKYGHVCFIDRDSLEEIYQLTLSKEGILKVFFDRDSESVVAITSYEILVYSSKTLDFKYKYRLIAAPIIEHFWNLLIYGYKNGKLSVLQLQPDKILTLFDEQTPVHNGEITSVSKGSNYLITSSLDGSVIVWTRNLEFIAKCHFPLPIYSACPLNGTRTILLATTKSIMSLDGSLIFDEEDEKDPVYDNFDERIDEMEPNKVQFMKRSYSGDISDFLKRFREENEEEEEVVVDPKKEARKNRLRMIRQRTKEIFVDMNQNDANQIGASELANQEEKKDGKLTEEDKAQLLRDMMDIEKSIGRKEPTIIKEERPKTEEKKKEEEEEEQYEYEEETEEEPDETTIDQAQPQETEKEPEVNEAEKEEEKENPTISSTDEYDSDDEEQKELLKLQKEQEAKKKQQEQEAQKQESQPVQSRPPALKQPKLKTSVSKENLQPKQPKPKPTTSQTQPDKEVTYVEISLESKHDKDNKKTKSKSNKDSDDNGQISSPRVKITKTSNKKKNQKDGRLKSKKGSQEDGEKDENSGNIKITFGNRPINIDKDPEVDYSDVVNKMNEKLNKENGEKDDESKESGRKSSKSRSKSRKSKKSKAKSIKSGKRSARSPQHPNKDTKLSSKNTNSYSNENISKSDKLNTGNTNANNIQSSKGDSSKIPSTNKDLPRDNCSNLGNQLSISNQDNSSANNDQKEGTIHKKRRRVKKGENEYEYEEYDDSGEGENNTSKLHNVTGKGIDLHTEKKVFTSKDVLVDEKIREEAAKRVIKKPQQQNVNPSPRKTSRNMNTSNSQQNQQSLNGVSEGKDSNQIDSAYETSNKQNINDNTNISNELDELNGAGNNNGNESQNLENENELTNSKYKNETKRQNTPNHFENGDGNDFDNFTNGEGNNNVENDSNNLNELHNSENERFSTPTKPNLEDESFESQHYAGENNDYDNSFDNGNDVPQGVTTLNLDALNHQIYDDDLNQPYFYHSQAASDSEYNEGNMSVTSQQSSPASCRPYYRTDLFSASSRRLYDTAQSVMSSRTTAKSTVLTQPQPLLKNPRYLTQIKKGDIGKFFMPTKKAWRYSSNDDSSFYPKIVSPIPQKQKLSDMQAIFKRINSPRSFSPNPRHHHLTPRKK